MRQLTAVVLLVCLAQSAVGQSHRTEHTYQLDDPDARPAATLDDVAWLVGNWSGEAFDASFEEHWNPPSAGSMIGFFKLLDGEAVTFYELLLLVEEEGSLSLKVKHFNNDNMVGYIVFRSGDEVREEKLVYRRNED